MKKILLPIVAFACAMPGVLSALTVSDVSAYARYPWQSVIDVDFTVSDSKASDLFKVGVSATCDGGKKKLYARTFLNEPLCGYGMSRVSWNIGADYPGLNVDDIQIAVTVAPVNPAAVDALDVYMVIDLSSGPNSPRYPVHYTLTPPELVPTNDLVACAADPNRTTKLWLKRVKGSVFPFGGTDKNNGEGEFKVKLSPYYIGVFELTQMQYALVTGKWPSHMTNDLYKAARPVEMVNYTDIIGHNRWPENRAVSEGTYIEKMRSRTGLSTFSLPTEAQWECACRAGYKKSLTVNKSTGRWNFTEASTRNEAPDEGGTAIVGSYLPNTWGLYDTLGNVWEMCLDAYADDTSLKSLYSGQNPVEDPIGPDVNATDRFHATRGGGWNNSQAGYCTAHRRDRGCNAITGTQNRTVGLRVAVSPQWK